VAYGSGGESAVSIAVADVNGDGKPDLLVANICADSSCTSGSVAVLLGNGDGTFQKAVAYSSGGYESESVAITDVNGDGKPDILVANYCASSSDCSNGSIGVLLGNGDGTFHSAVSYGSGGAFSIALAVGDLNGDGKPDVVVTNDVGVGVLLGDGDGTFQAAVNYNTGPSSNRALAVAIADVNGDSKLDLLVVHWCNDNDCGEGNTGTLNVLLGNGDGTFQSAVTYLSGGADSKSLAVADVNGDGKPDVVVTGCDNMDNCANGTAGVLLGNGDGTFQPAVNYASGGFEAPSVAVADLNGDGKPEVIVANECVVYPENCNGSVGVLINRSLNPSTTGLISSLNPSTFGQAVTLTATVTAQLGFYKGTPTGTVTFTYGSATLCNAVTLGGGTATCAYSALPVGSDVITATYSGDANFAPSSGTISQTVQQASTTTVVTSSLNPSAFNQQVTFTATVTGQFGGTPTGTATFSDGSTPLGMSPLSGGMAAFSTAVLAAGLHSINAVYSGDSNFLGSSASLNQTVNQASTTLALGSSVNPSGFGQPVTLTATISTQYGGQASGTINFKDGSTRLGSFTVSGNVARLTTSSLAIGTHSITAIYNGNLNFVGSTSPVLSQVVQGPTVRLSPTSLTFSTQVVFTASKAKTVKLSNTGLGVLTIKSIAMTGLFSQTHTCGTTVNPGGSCTISVTFKPTTIGTLTGSVSVTDNAPGSPQKLALKGTGTYIKLTPTSVNFGNQPDGTKSLAKSITLTNEGGVAVDITGISITGTNASDFAQTHTCGTSVASGSSCFIKVTFTPSATGTRTAQVSISDSGGGSPQKAGLIGTGTP
jgi:hypothetical protein